MEPRHIVKRDEEPDRAKYAVGKFGENHGQGKRKLAIGFGRGFAVEDETGKIVFWFYLGENGGWEDDCLKDDKDPFLKGGTGIVELEIGQPHQNRDGGVIEKPCEAIIGRSPERKMRASVDNLDLMPQWGCIFLLVDFGAGTHFLNPIGLDSGDFLFDGSELRG